MSAGPNASEPVVGVIMGSDSDWSTMSSAADALAEFDIPHEVRVVSAHRTPMDMAAYAQQAAGRGLRVIIAGAGGAAHLPGMVAAMTTLPVIGVPVATVSIGGARNAGLLAVRILAIADPELGAQIAVSQAALAEIVHSKDAALTERIRKLPE